MVDVRIKPLEWTKLSTGWIAHTPFHAYEIVATDRGFMATYANLDFAWGEEETMKLAAQADYERRILSTLSDAVAERSEPVASVAEVRADGQRLYNTVYPSDALDKFPIGTLLYTSPPASELEALRKRVAELESEREEDLAARETELAVSFDNGHYRAMSEHATPWQKRAEKAEARVAELEKALSGLLAPFTDDECRKDHHGYCQTHFLEEDCCVAAARRVREGGKVDG